MGNWAAAIASASPVAPPTKAAATSAIFAAVRPATSLIAGVVNSPPPPKAASPLAPFLTTAKATTVFQAAAAIKAYSPPAMTSSTIPVPTQNNGQTSVAGIMAKIAQLAVPARSPSFATFAPTPGAPVTGLSASPLGTSISAKLAAAMATPIAAYNPPAGPTVPAVTYQPPSAAASMPAANPPANSAASTAATSTTTALPSDYGTDPYGGSTSGGFDPGTDSGTTSDVAAPAAAATDWWTIALYGGGALVGLFLLSKMFKGDAATA